jgi:hypothetical protein
MNAAKNTCLLILACSLTACMADDPTRTTVDEGGASDSEGTSDQAPSESSPINFCLLLLPPNAPAANWTQNFDTNPVLIIKDIAGYGSLTNSCSSHTSEWIGAGTFMVKVTAPATTAESCILTKLSIRKYFRFTQPEWQLEPLATAYGVWTSAGGTPHCKLPSLTYSQGNNHQRTRLHVQVERKTCATCTPKHGQAFQLLASPD